MVDILLVEDNEEICSLLADFLRKENYTVSIAKTAEKALSLYEKYGARLVLLDINLPDIDGFSVCEKLRRNDNVPIIIITARTDRDDKLSGILLGADDYIEKPFDIEILLAKIKGIFKRRLARDMISDGNIILNISDGTVTKNGIQTDLSAKEFELLQILMQNKGQTLSKEFLFNRVWGIDSESEMQTLTVHIKYLREKIEDDPQKPEKIITVWGKGYRWS